MDKDQFTHHFRRLLDELEVTNTELAVYSGVDRTNISHFKSGKRVPTTGSRTIRAIIRGIISYSKKTGKWNIACYLAETSPACSEKELEAALTKYLFGENTAGTPSPKSICHPPREFAKRLTLTMQIADITNSQLARQLHIDSSMITRYKKGAFSLKRSNGETMSGICNILWKKLDADESLKKNFGLETGIPESELNKDSFCDYLYYSLISSNEDTASAMELLGSFDSYSPKLYENLPDYKSIIPQSVIDGTGSEYMGIDGIRNAVLRFLGNVAQNGYSDLYLYSDESMSWMSEDPTFKVQWASLMKACVEGGTHIHIIHNITRNLSEMNDAISSWLPLYMTGMIESFSCKSPDLNYFSHTIFLCPGYACIEASHVRGTESDGIYHFHTKEKELMHFKKAYSELLSASAPLIKPYTEKSGLTDSKSVVLEGKPFPNIRIEASENIIRITPYDSNGISFAFTHPIMCRAFLNFAYKFA